MDTVIFDNIILTSVVARTKEMTVTASGNSVVASQESAKEVTTVEETAATDVIAVDETAVADEIVIEESKLKEGVAMDGAYMNPGMGKDSYVDPGYSGEINTETGVAVVKDPLLSSWPFVIGISVAVLFVSVVLGAFLARRKIKKGIELYED